MAVYPLINGLMFVSHIKILKDMYILMEFRNLHLVEKVNLHLLNMQQQYCIIILVVILMICVFIIMPCLLEKSNR
jgi:hypothetical protein